ncbi:MAG: hypothetical protein AUI36_13150 [Cyanobacteria bacterium 13_1_40CM_2_61_4]|nr:MAG: hypothetical protein AUI36_13150 [Cyanobacteria bacterium 13_1_40CM_2_61_4]
MGMPAVSVVMAVRNGELYLRSAIASVLAQEYEPLELLVVDGHSTDDTPMIAQSYSQIRYIPQVNHGVTDAYNTGITAARGEFVAFLSHDDLWTSDKLRSQLQYMVRFPELQYTVARVKFFLELGLLPPPGFRRELLTGTHVAYILETLVARKSTFAGVGGFNVEFGTASDVEWFARAKDRGVPHAVIPKVLLHKRVHDRNISLNDASSNHILLDVLRQSIQRKRDHQSPRNDASAPAHRT